MNNEYQFKGVVGPAIKSDGAEADVRLDKSGAQVTTNNHPSYYEAAARGKINMVSNLVAGVAPGTAFSTTPTFCIWNPTGSGINAALIKCNIAYVSGTLGAGFVAYGANTQATEPTTGTALVPVNGLLGASRGIIRGYNGSTLTAAPTIVRSPFSMGPALATTAVMPFTVTDLIDGEIVVGPGQAFAVQMTGGAGTSPLVVISLSWEEIAV
jgi:hypothetical protein